jgi:hypothetical protein
MDPAGYDRVALRRYVTGVGDFTCEAGFHKAVAWTGETVETLVDEHGRRPLERPLYAADDPRWPAGCDGCDYRFTADDERQVWLEQVYARADTGELRVLHSTVHPDDIVPAEPGAMWDAVWMPEQWRGPDGISLMVRCPRGDGSAGSSDWPVDMPSTDSGGRWARSGDPRRGRVTVSPSIWIGPRNDPASYHGWLQSGVLSDPI